MDEPVDQCGSDHLITEDLTPGLEAAIGRDDDRAALITAGDKGEQQVRGLALQRQITDLIADHEPVAPQASQLRLQRAGALSFLEPVDPLLGGGEGDPVALLAGAVRLVISLIESPPTALIALTSAHFCAPTSCS